MIVGHYAAALVARPHQPRAPFWLLLLAANLAEFLWLVLALAGVEATEPSALLDATFRDLKVDMSYSHNLVPNLALSLAFGGAVWAIWKDGPLAAWCAALCHAHVWCDYLVGFEHQVLGAESMPIGINSYGRFPELAILLELAFAWICCAYYLYAQARRGRGLSPGRALWLLALLSIGILAWLPNATVSMREWMMRMGIG